MVEITFVSDREERTTITANAGDTLMQAALDHGVRGILGDCGGALSCATCHVHVISDWIDRVGAASDAEMAMLEMAIDPDETSRLSCQIELTEALDGLEVRLPVAQF